MKKTVLLLFLPVSLCAQTAYQDSIQKPITFIAEIYHRVTNDAENEPKELLRIDSLIRLVYTDSVWHSIDTAQSFQLLGLYDYYWEEVVGLHAVTNYSGNIRLIESHDEMDEANEFVDIQFSPFTHSTGSHDYLLESQQSFPIYSGKSMADSLYVPIRQVDSKTIKTNGFPVIFERDALNNTRWTVFQSGENLILRKVHSYPYGNMTSFYSETLVFFRLLNND